MPFSKKMIVAGISLPIIVILLWPVHATFGQKNYEVRVDQLGSTSLVSLYTSEYGWRGTRIEFIMGHLIPFNSWAGPPGRAYLAHHRYTYHLKRDRAVEVLDDRYDGGMEIISYKSRLYRLTRFMPARDEVPTAQIWDGVRFVPSPLKLRWSQWQKLNSNQVRTLSTRLKGTLSLQMDGRSIVVKEVPEMRRVEVHFPSRKQILFQGEEGKLVGGRNFWQRFTADETLK